MKTSGQLNNRFVVPRIQRIWRHDKTTVRFLRKFGKNTLNVSGEERASSADLLETALGVHVSKQRDVDFKRLGRCMRRLGWDGPKKTVIGGIQVKGYTRLIKAAR